MRDGAQQLWRASQVGGLRAAGERGHPCSLQPGLPVGSIPPPAHPPLPQQHFPEPAISFAPVPTGPGQPAPPGHQVSVGCLCLAPPMGASVFPARCGWAARSAGPGPVGLRWARAPFAPSLRFPGAWGAGGSGGSWIHSMWRGTAYAEYFPQICVSRAPGWVCVCMCVWESIFSGVSKHVVGGCVSRTWV